MKNKKYIIFSFLSVMMLISLHHIESVGVSSGGFISDSAFVEVLGSITSSITASPCSIPLNSSSCDTTLTYSIVNTTGTSTITTPVNVTVETGIAQASATPVTGTKLTTASYDNTSFYAGRPYSLNNNGAVLVSVNVIPTCAAGAWNGTICSLTNGGWGPWSSCLNGAETRYCTNPPPANGGTECPLTNGGTGTSESRACTGKVDGVWTAWFGGIPCGEGEGNEIRTCTNPTPANGGLDCVPIDPTKVSITVYGKTELRYFSRPACTPGGNYKYQEN